MTSLQFEVRHLRSIERRFKLLLNMYIPPSRHRDALTLPLPCSNNMGMKGSHDEKVSEGRIGSSARG